MVKPRSWLSLPWVFQNKNVLLLWSRPKCIGSFIKLRFKKKSCWDVTWKYSAQFHGQCGLSIGFSLKMSRFLHAWLLSLCTVSTVCTLAPTPTPTGTFDLFLSRYCLLCHMLRLIRDFPVLYFLRWRHSGFSWHPDCGNRRWCLPPAANTAML